MMVRVDEKSGIYQDQSTAIVCPTIKFLPVPVVASWFALRHPMNQKIAGPLFLDGATIDRAYNSAIDGILKSQLLSGCKYVLTMEHDNLPPGDGLLKLLESIQDYDAVGGLYWTNKTDPSYPMIFGNPAEDPESVLVQIPKQNTVQPCNAMGMGFTLFRLEMFRDKNIERPWFISGETVDGEQITRQTQDIPFFLKCGKAGYRFAVDTRVRVGHLNIDTGVIW